MANQLGIVRGCCNALARDTLIRMTDTSSTVRSLRRVFRESIVARDLAEPLASFDDTTELDTLREFMLDRPLSVLGIRHKGVVTGLLHQDQIDDRPISEQMLPLAEVAVVETTTPVQQVVGLLDETSFVLVSTLGQPVGVIMRGDLEKPPMRMWLFGTITLFEMSITRVLQQAFPSDAWRELLSPTRIEKAEQLQAERVRRNQQVQLVDCLQLSDKGQLFAKSDKLRELFWNRSRNEIRRIVKELESLRNNLAHSQPYTQENWNAILRLAGSLDGFLSNQTEYVATDSLQPYERDDIR
ncbi:CBS domain-containing protein [Rhodopirellula baltica WH47]|uniref:CBS domain-containing protein n=1 Tax=Rhodopirellula baltica WH47 TaxID=991778 RepID=F2AM42_RHOBT|nr:CBS domain-containing protein [Rhodopirellula baltica WH47]